MSQHETEFGEFFDRNWERCLRAVAASTGSMALAEDQTAEAFARAWASWKKVRCHPAPQAWVVRTALNAGATWWRKRSKETAMSGFDIVAADSREGGLDTPVLVALRRLPARQREAVMLRVLLDLDVETTAKQLGVAPGTVRAHLSRAMTALRRELGTEVAPTTLMRPA